MQITKNYSAGFTLTEVAVVIVMIPLIITMFIYGLYAISDDGARQSVQIKLNDSIQLAMDTIEYDIKQSTAFNESLTTGDPYGSDNNGAAWSFVGSSSTSRVLILSNVATTKNSLTDTKAAVYVDAPSLNCGFELLLNPPLIYNTVYFVKAETLYRRTIPDSSGTALCNGPAVQKLSCPPELSASWNASCGARDESIVSNVSEFTIDYYIQRQTSPYPNIYTALNPDDMKVIDDAEIILTVRKAGNPTDTTSTQKMRIARLNKL